MHIEVKTITLSNYCGFSKSELLWESIQMSWWENYTSWHLQSIQKV